MEQGTIGGNPHVWSFLNLRAEYFFEVAEVQMEDRVKVAALHLDGKALQWHRGYIGLRGETTYKDWSGYIHALAARFGGKAYADPLANLRNLKQVTSLQDYIDAYDALYPLTGVREDQALIFFLSGLVDELQMPVRMFKPKSLADAYALAKLQELTVAALHNKPKPQSNPHSSTNSLVRPISVTTTGLKTYTQSQNKENVRIPPTTTPKFGPRITSREMDERRAKGLCFWCEEKCTPGHHCTKKKVYALQLLEEEEDVVEEVVTEGETPTDIQLSLHAMWGIEGAQTMRIKGVCQQKNLRILVDTGSTHNFLSSQMAQKLKSEMLQIQSAPVEVADRQKLQCTHICKEFKWEMQGEVFSTEEHVIMI